MNGVGKFITCVCYGDKYSVEYVQKLYNMVTRNTTLHINFYVFTDHVKMHKMVDGHINIREFQKQIYKVGGIKCNCFILKLIYQVIHYIWI